MQARKMVGVTARYCCCRPRPDDDASLGPANQSRVEMDARPLMQLQIISCHPASPSMFGGGGGGAPPSGSRGLPDCDIPYDRRRDRRGIAHHAMALPNHLRNSRSSTLATRIFPHLDFRTRQQLARCSTLIRRQDVRSAERQHDETI